MGLFDQGKALLKAKQMQKELKNTEVEAKSGDGSVMVVINGEMHLKEIQLDESFLKPENKRQLEKNIQQTMSEAMSRAQAVAAGKTKDMMKDLNINFPGL